MMEYMNAGLKNSRPSMLDWFLNWVDTLKKQEYLNG